MYFNLREFASFTRQALFPTRNGPARPTPKRIGVLAGFYAIFVPVEFVTQISLLLDNLLFSAYRQHAVEQPLFIIGNPRSGTTFLQRLLAQDRRNFSCMKLWEILLAPSILQRRVVQGSIGLDRRLSSPLRRLARRLRSTWEEENPMHPTGLLAPEEDQYLLIHIWSTLAVWQFGAILKDEAEAYTHFDLQIPENQRRKITAFHKEAIQRHLYAHRRAGDRPKHYLAKNPSATPKIASMRAGFPDGRFIYLVRNPLDMVPSMISTLDYTWQVLGDPLERYATRDYVVEMAKHWYTYPLEQLAEMPDETYAIVRFNDLVDDPNQAVRSIYDRFGLDVDSGFGQVLKDATERSRHYESDHGYSLDAVGLSRAEIVTEFRDIFQRFDFDTREGTDGADARRNRSVNACQREPTPAQRLNPEEPAAQPLG
ncbi:MAG: sulfotransferase family protein [Anaerolineae bacterium]